MTRRKNLIWQIPFLLLLIVGTVFIVIQQHNMPYRSNRGLIFGTEYSITYQYDQDLGKEIEKALHQVDNSLSPFNPHSLITKMNNNQDTIADKMFTEVFRTSMKISEDTQGAFDITVAPLVNLWGFGFKKGSDPDKHSIDSLLQFVGYKKVSLDDKGHLRKSDPRVQLDCSAVAKGYGCDVVANVLRRHDIQNFMVEIGGEVVTCGVNDRRLPWRIGVTRPNEDPLKTAEELQTVLNVTDKAMATSGNYRNFYYKGGKRYAHTIDPSTGYPVEHSLLSATVLARDCATADAYATSFMVMGMERAREVLARHPELMVYFIYSDSKGKNAVWYSESLRDKIAAD